MPTKTMIGARAIARLTDRDGAVRLEAKRRKRGPAVTELSRYRGTHRAPGAAR